MLVVFETPCAQHHYYRPFKVLTHAFERTGTEKSAPISMGPSFFHDAEEQDDSENDSENDDNDKGSAHSGDESLCELSFDHRCDPNDIGYPGGVLCMPWILALPR